MDVLVSVLRVLGICEKATRHSCGGAGAQGMLALEAAHCGKMCVMGAT